MDNSASQKYNILVLDDEQLILMTVGACLRDSPYQVTTANNAEKALEIFKGKRFDAIISDIMMDPVDGFTFRDMVRNYNARIPIIFFTSLMDDINSSLIQRVMSDNYSYYINKNFSRKALLEKLDQVVHAYQAQTEIFQLNQRMEKDLELATQVQRSMLPAWVCIDKKYEYSYTYKPYFKISGDLFEWFPLDADRSLMVFGDISGHGIHSALTMVAVQAVLKQFVAADLNHMLKPHFILQKLNDYFCEKLSMGIYMTCLVGIWDFQEDTVLFHNAGHPEILCFGTDGKSRREVNPENRGGLPVGMMPDTIYKEEENVLFSFTEEDLFLIYSDGVFDLVNEENSQAEVNMELLQEIAPVLAGDNCSINIPFRLSNTLEQIGFTKQLDDCAILGVRKRSSAPEFRRAIFPDLQSIDIATQEALEFVSEHFYPCVELAAKLELLLSEFLVNIVKHGLGGNQKNGELIVLVVSGDDRELRVTVWDRGKVWNVGELRSDESLDGLLMQLSDDQKQSGRGIPIIMKISPRIIRKRFDGVNETHFAISRAQEYSAES